MATTVNPQEIAHFSKDSPRWWDESGPFAPLHRLNPARLAYIAGEIRQHYGLAQDNLKPFKKLDILDIGCGGGLVCEPLARLGGNVTGIDADENAVIIARDHAKKSGLAVDYRHGSAEDLKKTFDVVLALEIVEHVEDVDNFVENCVRLSKPGGLIVFSTLNRTPRSFALGVVAAEYILRWVPQGTHSWKKFVKPSELAKAVRAAGAREKSIKGFKFNVMSSEFQISDDDISVNYFLTAEK